MLPTIAHRQNNSLRSAGFEPVTYADVHVEPTNTTFLDCARFLKQEGPFGAVISFGGGSSMDTAKAGILYSCHPPPEVRLLLISWIWIWIWILFWFGSWL
jgi:alcohol dehydrogenase class IV